MVHRRIRQREHAHTNLHPHPLHNRRPRRSLGPRHVNPLLRNQALRNLHFVR